MTDREVINACIETVEELRERFVPNPATRYITSTGSMAFNALQYRIEQGVFRVWIDEQIAPYVVFTNEAWLSAKWNGKKNPNEGWWQRFCDEFARRLARKLQGEIR